MNRQIYIFIIFLLFPTIVQAQSSEISLQEISFNAETDFLKLKNISAKNLNLLGLEFWDDKLFKTVEQDIQLAPEQTITLTFNSSTSDTSNQLFTTYKGLTATTEQIIIKQNQQVKEFFCWVSEKPSQTELKEWEKNNYSQYWNNQELNKCFPSQGLKKSQSILRKTLGQTVDNWQAQALPEKENKTKTSTKKPSKKSTTITLSNDQTPTKQIIISEIFPAPNQKSTQKTEWIELFNPSTDSVNLTGWYLDDEDGGSKPYQFENIIIKSGEAILIGASQSKLNLNNSDEQVRLFNSQEKLIDLLEYKKSIAAQSYSLISFTNNASAEPLWLWSEQTSPGQPNPQLVNLEGTISQPAQFQTPYFFEIINPNKQAQLIIFDEKTLPAALAKTILIKDHFIKLSAFPVAAGTIQNAPNQPIFQLHSIDSTPPTEPLPTDFNLNIPIICVIIGTALYLLQKKYQWIKLT